MVVHACNPRSEDPSLGLADQFEALRMQNWVYLGNGSVGDRMQAAPGASRSHLLVDGEEISCKQRGESGTLEVSVSLSLRLETGKGLLFSHFPCHYVLALSKLEIFRDSFLLWWYFLDP